MMDVFQKIWKGQIYFFQNCKVVFKTFEGAGLYVAPSMQAHVVMGII